MADPNLSTTNTGNTTTVTTDGNTQAPPAPADPISSVDVGGGQNIYDLTASQVNTPSLPTGTNVTPVAQTVGQGELLNNTTTTPAAQAQTTNAQAAQIKPVEHQTAEQASTDKLAGQQADALQGAQYDASHATAAQGTASTGTVSEESTVQGQLKKLMDPTNFQNGDPVWAIGARNAAEEALAARGLGASSIAGQAITAAIMQAGLQVASEDAKVYATMDLTNLNNEQQMNLANLQNRQQAMLSDQAADNAAKQFNAQSKTQVATFFANLMATIDQSNVAQANAMKQANMQADVQTNIAQAGLVTDVSKANAAQANAISVSNAAARDAMQKFYDGQQLVIDQSNASWRRDINTANTAAENTANQLNAANLLSLSNTAMNNIWQAARDNASWVHTSSENDKDRAANMAIAALNNQMAGSMLNQSATNDFLAALGGFGFDLVKNIFKK